MKLFTCPRYKCKRFLYTFNFIFHSEHWDGFKTMAITINKCNVKFIYIYGNTFCQVSTNETSTYFTYKLQDHWLKKCIQGMTLSLPLNCRIVQSSYFEDNNWSMLMYLFHFSKLLLDASMCNKYLKKCSSTKCTRRFNKNWQQNPLAGIQRFSLCTFQF